MLFSKQVRAHKFIKRAVLGEEPTRLTESRMFYSWLFYIFKTMNRIHRKRGDIYDEILMVLCHIYF